MSKAPAKPSRYAIQRLSRETGKSIEICEAAYLQAQCIYDAALSILRGKQGALKHVPTPEPPLTAHIPLVLTNGVQLREGMTPAEIEAANPYPRPTGNRVADRARRLAAKCANETRTAEQWARFEAMHRSTYVEVAA